MGDESMSSLWDTLVLSGRVEPYIVRLNDMSSHLPSNAVLTQV